MSAWNKNTKDFNKQIKKQTTIVKDCKKKPLGAWDIVGIKDETKQKKLENMQLNQKNRENM